MKKYWTSLTKDYTPDWTAANAVREVLQNCLDSPASFEYDISGDILTLTSVGVTIPPKTLLMGVSGKRNDPDSVGGKGEGFKLSAVILLREGYGLKIYNGNVLWEPAFEYHEDFDCEVLVFNESSGFGSDLTFEISGVDEWLTEQIIHDCLYLQKDLGEVREGTRGKVLLDIPGKLYVGGLYVTDIVGHKYGYDFKPQYLPLNRDRKSVESWDLAKNTGLLLTELFPAETVAELIQQRAKDVNYAEYHSGSSSGSTSVYEASHKLMVDKYGEDVVVVKSYDDQQREEKRGLKNVVVVSSDTQYTYIQRSHSYQAKYSELEEGLEEAEAEDTSTPVEMLEKWYNSFEYIPARCDMDVFDGILDKFRDKGVSWE